MTARNAKIMRRIGCAIAGVGLAVVAWTYFAPSASPNGSRDSQSALGADATTRPADISADAKPILDELHDAYAGLKGLTIKGTVHRDADIDGAKHADDATLTGSYNTDGRFRAEISDSVLLVNTGKSIFIFSTPDNLYKSWNPPKDKISFKTLDPQVAGILTTQNLPLSLAISGDPTAAIADGALTIQKAADVTIDGAALPAITVSYPDRDITIAVDSKTHFIRRESVDLTKLAKLRGAKDVKSAMETLDFLTTTVATPDDQQFAWAPPAGAQDADQAMDVPALAGKPAPAFKLTDLSTGKQVDSADLKGTVYVLDFWATWCGPCVESLPELQQTYEDLKPQGLKVFAVNLEEDKPTVTKFVTDKKMTIPVLMDTDGATGKAYGAQGIPETVVVDKNGSVRKVFVGAGQEPDIRKEIEAALK